MSGDLTREAHVPSSEGMQALAKHDGGMQRVSIGGMETIRMTKPRDLKEIVKAVQDEASLAGDEVLYSWTVKDKKKKNPDGTFGLSIIEGLSIGGAMICARNYGNCCVEAKEVIETPTAFLMPAQFVDLERGFTVIRQFRQAKTRKGGANYEDGRAEEIQFAIGQSKAIRNVIVAAMPPSLVVKAMESAKADIRGKLNTQIFTAGLGNSDPRNMSPEQQAKTFADGIPIIRDRMLKKLLTDYGVTAQRVLDKFGKSTVEGIDPDDMVIIFSDLTHLKNRTETAEHLYPLPDNIMELQAAANATTTAPVEDTAQTVADMLASGALKPGTTIPVTKPETETAGDAAGPAAETANGGKTGKTKAAGESTADVQ